MGLNSDFCEWELYDGTAPEQKAGNAQKWLEIDVTATFKILQQAKILPFYAFVLQQTFFKQ